MDNAKDMANFSPVFLALRKSQIPLNFESKCQDFEGKKVSIFEGG